ncbi:DUF2087 domain-containing protein [Cohnella sp. REN36]|uniref:DUF2087 domain-containing protein n=1 Tax=Cohnella sp. REN36 TaxID=2887347 RepID=UPI001D15388B|nr:DUF2087 domain-containing protein [Cohnella sp. REN36]MCC3375111.1 DUF2087 domain-containing protein [Cohnella sp. REN36]
MNYFEKRVSVTEAERAELVRRFFKDGPDGRLTHIPKKEKPKLVVLHHVVHLFETGRTYTEKEVNALLQTRFEDFATLRRNLVDYRFLAREPDGSRYWLASDKKEEGEGA